MTAAANVSALRPVRGAPPAVVELEGIDMAFKAGVDVLTGVDLALSEGEFIAIVGPSGCGKSTLLRLISGLLAPSAGRVRFQGNEVAGPQRGVGFMFQRDALLPWASVADNIRVGLDCRNLPRAEHDAKIEELLKLLGLEGYGGYRPAALSGGMRQRVALGRLLAYEPDVYLMDEPFGALDVITKHAMGRELLRIWEQRRKPVVFVTHDIDEAVGLADRVIVMSGRPGRIQAEYRVDLPRPRDLAELRRSVPFHDLVDRIWRDLGA